LSVQLQASIIDREDFIGHKEDITRRSKLLQQSLEQAKSKDIKKTMSAIFLNKVALRKKQATVAAVASPKQLLKAVASE
jgi:hypothetical protein